MPARRTPLTRLIDAIYDVEQSVEDADFLRKGYLVIPGKVIDKAVKLAENLDPRLNDEELLR